MLLYAVRRFCTEGGTGSVPKVWASVGNSPPTTGSSVGGMIMRENPTLTS